MLQEMNIPTQWAFTADEEELDSDEDNEKQDDESSSSESGEQPQQQQQRQQKDTDHDHDHDQHQYDGNDNDDNDDDTPVSNKKMLFQPSTVWFLADLAPITDMLPAHITAAPSAPHPMENATTKKNKYGRSKKQHISAPVPSPIDTKAAVELLREYAHQLLTEEELAFQGFRKKTSPSDFQWQKTVMKSGTLSDRVSALSLAIHESPLHNRAHIENLVGMCKKNNRREAMIGVDTLKDLVMGSGAGSGLLPGDRKLKFLAEQPVVRMLLPHLAKTKSVDMLEREHRWLRNPEVQKHFILWAFEDMLKARYFEFLTALDQLSHDSVQHIKSKVIAHAWDLLTQKKEQERTLLTFLVNKLGEQDGKLASKTAYLLHQMLERHPLMKMVVVKEVELLLHRKGISERAQYYAMIFLNQVVLSKRTPDVLVARYLVHVYFDLFEQMVQSSSSSSSSSMATANNSEDAKNEDQHPHRSNKNGPKKDHKHTKKTHHAEEELTNGVEAKIMSALLTGINRAFPYASQRIPEDDSPEAQAQQTATTEPGQVKLLLGSSKLEDIYEKHIDMLFKITHMSHLPFATSTQALQLIHHILWKPSNSPGASEQQSKEEAVDDSNTLFSPKLTARYYRALYALLLDTRLPLSSKHLAIFFNLLFKSMKRDSDGNRLVAVIRRFLQTCLSSFGSCPALCAGLIVMSEVLRAKKQSESEKEVWVLVERLLKENIDSMMAKFQASTASAGDDEDSEEEKFVDVDTEDEVVEKKKQLAQKETKPTTIKKTPPSTAYDPLNRCPEFANAKSSSLWEMVPLAYHYHPTVSLFARTLLFQKDGRDAGMTETNTINYPSDPLQDFTLIRFLDRFVYKNPKKSTKDGRHDHGHDHADQDKKGRRGDSQMQPKSYQSSILRKNVPMDREFDAPVNSALWRERNERNVPADEQFYVPYFRRKDELSQQQSKTTSADKKQSKLSDELLEVGAGEVDDEDAELASDLEEEEVMDAIMNSAPGGRNEMMPDDEDDSDIDEDADFAAMMAESDDDDDDQEDEIDELGDDMEAPADSDGSWSDVDETMLEMDSDLDEEDDDDDDDDSLVFGDDQESGDELDGEAEDGLSKADQRRQKKATIRERLGGESTAKQSRFNVNRVAASASAATTATTTTTTKQKKKGGNVFASADDFAHLLQDEREFQDPWWKTNAEAQVPGGPDVVDMEHVDGGKKRKHTGKSHQHHNKNIKKRK